MKGNRCMRGMKKRRNHYHSFLLLVCVMAAAVGLIFRSGSAVNADDDIQERYKYYTSVYIDRDETLWNIASEYMSDEYADIRDYMDEVKTINHLTDDELEYGTTICVPYYSGEYK